MQLSFDHFRSRNPFGRTFTFGLLVSLLTPMNVFGDEPVAPRGTDIVLQEQGALIGSLVNDAGQPIAAAKVQILHNSRLVAATTTDESGRFAFRSLRNGTHILETDGATQVVRFWGESAAPPAAVDHLTVVVRPDALVRGQAASTPGLLGNPWFIAGVVGIAVGTVMIVENQNDDDGSAGANRLASP